MLQLSAEASHKMQKYLKLLNFRLDVVVSDVTGLTGLKIIADICKVNLDPVSLAQHRHYNCRKSEAEIAKALKGNNRKDYLFGLKQEYDSYLFYQKKIKECEGALYFLSAITFIGVVKLSVVMASKRKRETVFSSLFPSKKICNDKDKSRNNTEIKNATVSHFSILFL